MEALHLHVADHCQAVDVERMVVEHIEMVVVVVAERIVDETWDARREMVVGDTLLHVVQELD